MNEVYFAGICDNLTTTFSYLRSLNYAIALYKIPNSDKMHLIADIKVTKIASTPHLETLHGFVMCPFVANDKDFCFLISPTISLNFEQFQQTEPKNNSSSNILSGVNVVENYAEEKSNFIKIVNQAQNYIKNSELKKIVLSRKKELKLPNNFDALTLFKNLVVQYQNSFVSLVFTPEHGTWIGATPEVLLQIDKNNVFHTVALAGTKYKSQYTNISQTLWTQKEIEEQALVSRYIINCFKKIRLREYDDDGPKTISQGNLLHLKTDYTVDLNSVNYINLATTLLELLHPTSAVCGMPKELAMPLISKLETHNRSFYAGYLGAINMKQDKNEMRTDIFVNLRCVHINESIAVLFAGAGITAESNPESEFEETENKFNIILDVLKKM